MPTAGSAIRHAEVVHTFLLNRENHRSIHASRGQTSRQTIHPVRRYTFRRIYTLDSLRSKYDVRPYAPSTSRAASIRTKFHNDALCQLARSEWREVICSCLRL